MLPEQIITSRLRLRKPKLDDAQAIFEEYASHAEVTRYMAWPTHRSVDDTKAFLTHAIDNWGRNGTYAWVVTLKDEDRAVGSVALNIQKFRADTGYILAKRFWGQGLIPEAVAELVRLAFAQPNIFRVWAVCESENPASGRVLEKVGMSREGLLRRWMVFPNIGPEPQDCLVYSVVRDEYTKP